MQPLSRRKFLAMGGAMAAMAPYRLAHCQSIPRWIDRSSHGPFHCQATFPLAPLAPTFHELAVLERELQRTLALPPACESIDLFLLSDAKSHRQFLQQLYPRTPYRRALFVRRNGRSSIYAYRHPELDIDLRHESTHALLHANLAMVPLWLDEGIAEYFEMAEPERAFHHPHLSKLRWRLRLFTVKSVEWLETKETLDAMGKMEYQFSWAWVHFMLHGPIAAHRVLVHYLSDIRQGNPPGLFSQRLRQAIPRLEERMVQHFKHWQA
jgi:hypothetical protein